MADKNESKLFFGGKAVDDFVENHEHVSPLSLYIKVLVGLFILTGLTYAVSYADLGPASLPVAMIVAAMKATLVCAFFMHLKYDDKFHVFIFVSSLLFVAIFFTFTIFDLSSRDRLLELQATDYRRSDGGWDDMGRMAANNRNTDQNKPQCTDGSIPVCDQTFAACNAEGEHGGHGEGEFLVRQIEDGCFVSKMVPRLAAHESGLLFEGPDGRLLDQNGHQAKAQKAGSRWKTVVVDADGNAVTSRAKIEEQPVFQPVMVDAGCALPDLGCLNPHTVEGHEAQANGGKPKPQGGAEAEADEAKAEGGAEGDGAKADEAE